jgi:type IV secretion system protein VirB5
MKNKALALSVALGVTAIGGVTPTAPVYASGIPVIDVAHIAETVMQYQEMIKQLETLNSQLNQAKQQYESLTGSRGLGNLARSTGAIPKNWQETLASMQNGELGQLSKQIRESASLLDEDFFAEVDEAIKGNLDESMAAYTDQQALNQSFYDTATSRAQKMESLANQIDSASDMKAISDLQARVAVEQAQLTNELIKIQSLNQIAQQKRETRAQQQQQAAFETSFKY